MDLWQQRKLLDSAAMELLVESRSRGLCAALSTIEASASRRKMYVLKDSIKDVGDSLYDGLLSFREHPLIDEWMEQFVVDEYKKKTRFKSLLFTASSQAGKSWKALSLFGINQTLKVNCQGLGLGILPSISNFDRNTHRAILWDEIRTDQVTANKEVFQSGAFAVTMSQSQCNAFSYEVWLYQTAHILCSNEFALTMEEAKKETAEDIDWLQANIMHVPLPVGQRWYLD